MLDAARRHLRLVLALAAAGGLIALAGCGGDDADADIERGKQLFVQRCGSCHVLADANARGTIGPNLDLAFAQSIADGLGRDTIRGVVRKQIEVPLGPEMPANLVTGQDADAVAAYVAEVVARGDERGATGDDGGGRREGATR